MFGRIGEAGYVLSTQELVFLAGLAGAKELYGIEDNTHELEKKEMIKEWIKVKSNLLNKRYIQCEDDRITVDRELFLLIDACCNPEVYIKHTSLNTGDLKHLRNVYITNKIAVEIDKSRQNEDIWFLTPLVNIGKVANNLSECFIIEKNYQYIDCYFEIPLKGFLQLEEKIKKGHKEDAVRLLRQLGLSEDATHDYIKACAMSNINSFMTMIRDSEGNKDIKTLWFLKGKNYLWKIEFRNINLSILNDENKISISTVESQQIVSEIEDIVINFSDIFLSALSQEW